MLLFPIVAVVAVVVVVVAAVVYIDEVVSVAISVAVGTHHC